MGGTRIERSFAERMGKVHRSFVREILKVTESPGMISFAGGLPNPRLFPVDAVSRAAGSMLAREGEAALQYSTTEGYPPLREFIAKRYAKKGIDVDPDDILITTGSQQGLDLSGKVFLNRCDRVVVERPTYLAAIQSFGMFEPVFTPVPLDDDGIDIDALEKGLSMDKTKIAYLIPSFQNPTGISYSQNRRREASELLREGGAVLVEDDPYGDLRFMGDEVSPMKSHLGDDSILLGSFSKIFCPGVRLGWACAGRDLMEKLVVAKQASDLHTDGFSQRVLYQYLMENDIDLHISKIKAVYRRQRDLMVKMIEELLPEGVRYTRPEGGMFIWLTLPEGVSSLDLFHRAIKDNVAFVPGEAFYVDGGGKSSMRLNYSNSDEEKIVEGMMRLARVIKAAI